MNNITLHEHEKTSLVMLSAYALTLLCVKEKLDKTSGGNFFSEKKKNILIASIEKACFVAKYLISPENKEAILAISGELLKLKHSKGDVMLLWATVFTFEQYFTDLKRIFLSKQFESLPKNWTLSDSQIFSLKKKFKYSECSKLNECVFAIKKQINFL